MLVKAQIDNQNFLRDFIQIKGIAIEGRYPNFQ